jgi:hypothetical protein
MKSGTIMAHLDRVPDLAGGAVHLTVCDVLVVTATAIAPVVF